MIIDMICDLCNGCTWTKKDAMSYVADWSDTINPDLCMRIVDSLSGTGNYKAFKEACMDYMMEYGYEGSIAWKKFKTMPIKAIKTMFNA